MKQAKKVCQIGGTDNPLYSETKIDEKVLNEINVKTTTPSYAYRVYASTCKVEFLNFFSSEYQFKKIESAIKNNVINLSSKLRGFKFMTTSVLRK